MRKKGDSPYWNEDTYKKVLASGATTIVLLLGTNDAKKHNYNRTEFEKDYIAMVKSF